MQKSEAVDLLPKVGESMWEAPSFCGIPGLEADRTPHECVCVEVHTRGLWYRVRFKDTGFYECYKVPRLKISPFGKLL